MPAALMAFMTRRETTFFDSFWKISMTKRPPSSGGMGSRFITPSDTEIMAVNSKKGTKPASANCLDITAMPTTDDESDTVCAAVAGLNRLATAWNTIPI